MLRLAAAGLLILSLLAPTMAAEWPSFHNDARHTGFISGSSYPVYTDVWWNNRTPENAQVKASPVLKENILITASLGSPLATPPNNGLVRALDAASGKELWRHKMAAPIESTPAISGERVYVVDTAGNLKALNLRSGGVEHTAAVGATLGHLTHNEGKLFIGTEAGEVKAYLASTLTLLWTFASSSVGDDGTFNNATQSWGGCTATHSPLPIRAAPTVFQGKVIVGSMNHWIYALDEAGTGIGAPPKTFVHWSYQTGDVVLTTGAINSRVNQDPRIVFGSYDGKVYSFATMDTADQGARDVGSCRGWDNFPIWEFEVPTIVDSDTGDEQVSKVHSSPAAAGDKVFFGANNGKVYGLASENGQQLWETTAGNVLQPVTSSPAVANGKIVIGSEDKKVYWINATDGKVLKTFTTQSAIDTSPAIEGDRAFIAARDGTLYMFGPEIPTRADLVVTGISGTGSVLQVSVKNQGDRAAGNTTLRLFAGGTFLSNSQVPALGPGNSTTVTATVTLTGAQEIRAVVDPDAGVTESNDSNNELTSTVTLGAVPTSDPGDGGGGGGGGGIKIPAPGLPLLAAGLALALVALRRRK